VIQESLELKQTQESLELESLELESLELEPLELEQTQESLELEPLELEQTQESLELEPLELEQTQESLEPLELDSQEHELAVESHEPAQEFDTVENVQPDVQMAICVDTTYCITFSILPRKMPVSDYRNRFHLCDKQDI
jgi:hypothetical protein